MSVDKHPSIIQKWLVALRPFALPASVMPVIYGAVLACTIGDAAFKTGLFLASLFGIVFLHTGSNLMNDVYDYRKGLDKQVNPVSGAVVRGWLTPKQVLIAAWIFIVLGTLLGLWIVSQVGPVIFWLGLIGLAIGLFYTWGLWPLKFHALGDLAVFLNFGILGALGSWTVQTSALSWVPMFWSVSMSLLVIGILHGNNWRDIQSDRKAGIQTVANLLGDQGSKVYFQCLIYGPFVVTGIIFIITRTTSIEPAMPWTFFITLLAFPLALHLDRKSELRKNPEQIQAFLALDGAVAQLNLLFGILCTLAAILSVWIG